MLVGRVQEVDIDTEMRGAYLDYAMSVITARALPDVRDGLKPVQRRILYAMHQMRLRHDTPYRKSARIVGNVLGKFHPHGDMAVYDAMVRMAQDFSMRYPLVDGQGNVGSVDGDSPAAMRYTEARMAPLAEEMLLDIEKDTVDFVENFDGTLKEPSVLPGSLPQLLLNGASGIAVGMATNIPPHNLSEICDALIYMIDHADSLDDVSIDDLMRFIRGPDFPTGGLVYRYRKGRGTGAEESSDVIRKAYTHGRGRLIVRAKAYIEEMSRGRHRIVVTELPYQVNKARLIERIAKLAREGSVEGISDLRDESDRRGMRLVIEVKRTAQPRTLLNQLFKRTQLQMTFGVIMLALVDGVPQVLSLKKALGLYLEHRREIVERRTRYDLALARQRAHILEGLRIALDNLDAIIDTIRRSRRVDTARRNLRRKFKLTEVQAQAILDMPLRRLAGMERRKIEAEYKDKRKLIRRLERLLASPKEVLTVIKQDLQELKASYGDQRRTRVLEEEVGRLTARDLVPDKDVLITITQRGYIKRIALDVYQSQKRGGKGVLGMVTRGKDVMEHLLVANTHDNILFFSNRGRAFQLRAHRIPEGKRRGRGLPLVNLIDLRKGEKVTTAIAVPDRSLGGASPQGYLVMATRKGKVKRTDATEFENVRPSGLMAIKLDRRDNLCWVELTMGGQELILVTKKGQAIRFSEEEIRPMGRNAGGVMGIKLGRGDRVVAMGLVRKKSDLLIVTEKGYAKRTQLSEYSRQRRHGVGLKTVNRSAKTGPVVAGVVVDEKDEIAIISEEGAVIRTPIKEIPQLGRATQGAVVMRLGKGDRVASIVRLDRSAG